MACFDARVGSTRASQCPDCDEVREHCVNAPLATWFLGPPRPTDTKTHTHTLHIPHIVFFFDNSFSYIMNPIHIKGWTGGSTGVAPSPPEWAKTAWENKLFPLFLPPCSLSHHKGYQVWDDGHVLLIMCVLNKYCNGHLICCGVLSVLGTRESVASFPLRDTILEMRSSW